MKRYHMLKFKIGEASFVDVPAQDGADALFMKRGDAVDVKIPQPRVGETREAYAKRFVEDDEMVKAIPSEAGRVLSAIEVYDRAASTIEKGAGVPVLTSAVDGHAHLVWLCDGRGGETSYGSGPDDEYGHSHPWIIGADGSITVAENDGHSHVVDPSALQAAFREIMAGEEIPVVVADVVFARSADGSIVDPGEVRLGRLVSDLESGVVKASVGGVSIDRAYMLDGSYPIRTQADLVNAIASAGSSPSSEVARHIVKRARVLGLAGEGDVSLSEIAKFIAGPAGESNAGGTDVTNKPNTPPETVSKADHDAVVAQLELAKAEATLSDAQRAHYATLEGDAKSAFLGKSSADRDAVLENLSKGDPVVYTGTDGVEYRKSDDPRLVALAKRADEDRKALIAEKALRDQSALEKRAAEQFPNLKGTVATRAALLKAVDGIEDETVRKSIGELLKAADEASTGIFVRKGTSSAPSSDGIEKAADKLDKLAKAHASEKGVSYLDAYDAVSRANPELAGAAIEGR